mmetsp:Transcript_40519/g.67691  ORF Transcript_40519/g.67691 Transcript_40519/m.67691 type:complete len:384 (-) Transcript_40519:1208-2359(-)
MAGVWWSPVVQSACGRARSLGVRSNSPASSGMAAGGSRALWRGVLWGARGVLRRCSMAGVWLGSLGVRSKCRWARSLLGVQWHLAQWLYCGVGLSVQNEACWSNSEIKFLRHCRTALRSSGSVVKLCAQSSAPMSMDTDASDMTEEPSVHSISPSHGLRESGRSSNEGTSWSIGLAGGGAAACRPLSCWCSFSSFSHTALRHRRSASQEWSSRSRRDDRSSFSKSWRVCSCRYCRSWSRLPLGCGTVSMEDSSVRSKWASIMFLGSLSLSSSSASSRASTWSLSIAFSLACESSSSSWPAICCSNLPLACSNSSILISCHSIVSTCDTTSPSCASRRAMSARWFWMTFVYLDSFSANICSSSSTCWCCAYAAASPCACCLVSS